MQDKLCCNSKNVRLVQSDDIEKMEFENLLMNYLHLNDNDKAYVLGFIHARTMKDKVSA